ncbi:MAG: hypothetical protein PHC89_01090 [Candidatus Pacebacteria bacterium]|nr:hypothetical protein [Candidatus Paceibacterota bacterium]
MLYLGKFLKMAQKKSIGKQVMDSLLTWILRFLTILGNESLQIMRGNSRITFYVVLALVVGILVTIFPSLLLIIAVSAIVIGGYKILKGLGHL